MRRRRDRWPRALPWLALLPLLALGAPAAEASRLAGTPLPKVAPSPTPAPSPSPSPSPVYYDVTYDVRLVPSERAAHVAITFGPHRGLLTWLRFRADPDRYTGWIAEGDLAVDGERVRWTPPKGGGTIRYTYRIDHLRDAAAYDARAAEKWALFRGHDLVPTVRVRGEEWAYSRSILRFRLPNRWRVVTAHRETRDDTYALEDPQTRFDRPTSWILAGRLGVLREKIARCTVTVAGPIGQSVRRQDMLALLRWSLPELRDALGRLPKRLLIVSAGDPMWRGGLSAPASVFLHADRPLISGDLTSPLLHEVVHAVVGTARGPGVDRSDWIREGLAEYYSLEMLRRSNTVSGRRYERALRRMAERGSEVSSLAVAHARGATTARAVTVLHELDEKIRDATDDDASLDTVVAALAKTGAPLTNAELRAAAEEVGGRDLGAFFRQRVGVKAE